jgi:penicillin-binding protein 2
LQLVKSAMVAVNKVGTGRTPFRDTEYVAAGKTGTAQVIGIRQNEKYDASKIAERHRDHSLFVAFAPADKPKIALALIVENGGFGAQAAAPIARKVFDYYLLGKLPKDQDLPFPDRQDEEELRDVPESMEPELAPGETASGTPLTAAAAVAAAPAPVAAAPRASIPARQPAAAPATAPAAARAPMPAKAPGKPAASVPAGLMPKPKAPAKAPAAAPVISREIRPVNPPGKAPGNVPAPTVSRPAPRAPVVAPGIVPARPAPTPPAPPAKVAAVPVRPAAP